MKLYEVCNGYRGYDYTHVLVTAENEERAKELAKTQFQKGAVNPYGIKPKLAYKPNYWTDLETEVIFEDCSEENASSVR